MKSENVVQEKSYRFAVRIVRMYQHLAEQVLRSGTGIGANVEEALGGQSTADFLAKLTVAYKEARETSYWLRLLKDTDYLAPTEFESIHAEADELCRILSSIQTTTKKAHAHLIKCVLSPWLIRNS